MLDQKLAMIGCICGIMLLLYAISIGKGIGLSFTLFFSCLIYLIITHWKDIDVRATFHSHILNRSKLRVIHVTNTFCLILFFLISVYFILYFRPLEYFLLASIFSAIIGLEILTFPDGRSRFFVGSILLQILLLSTSLRWGVTFEFPGLIGSDSWYHSLLTEYIMKNGRVISPLYRMGWTPVQVSEYGSFPFTHLIVAMTGLVTSIQSYKVSSVSSIGVFEVVSLLFVFLMTRKTLSDVRLPLLATLFVGVSNWHIVYGFALIPQSLGYGFFALVIYLLVKQTLKPTYSNLLLIFLALFSTILSHTVTSFVLVVTIAAFFLSKRFYPYFVKNPPLTLQKVGITLSLTLFSGISVLVYWIFYTDFFTERVLYWMWDLRTTGTTSPAFKSYIHYEFDQLGIYFLYILAVIGCLIWLKKRERSLLKFTLIISTSTFLFFIYGSWLLGLRSILPSRWFVFVFILIAVPAAEGLKNLVKTGKREKMLILTTLLIFFLTFLMITTDDANKDSPLFKKEEVVGASYLESEMCAAETINGFLNGTVYADQGFAGYFWWVLKRNMTSINFIAFEPPREGIVIERNYFYERPTSLRIYGPYIRVNRTFEITLQNMNKVYCNGEVAAYTRPR